METTDHLDLKRLAVAYLRAAGCVAVGVEVRSPISAFRFDAAGWRDGVMAPRRLPNGEWGVGRKKTAPESIIIECKQCRADFLRDSRDRERLLERRARLLERKERLEEERIKPREPHLRRIDRSLYEKREEWDFSRTSCIEHRDLVNELERIERRLRAETKFGDIARWALADRLYLCAPSGLIRKREVPPGWGLIECRRSRLRSAAGDPARALTDDLVLRVEAEKQPCDPDRRVRMLRNIAASATRSWLNADDSHAALEHALRRNPNTLQTQSGATESDPSN